MNSRSPSLIDALDSGRVPSEEWRPIASPAGGYEASSHGRIRSPRGLIAGTVDRDGYLRVRLKDQRAYRAHRLVCEAFHGPPPEGCEVAHLDGNRLNNRQDNLVWASRAENMSHKALHGTSQGGERNGRAKLSDADVASIRSATKLGYSRRTIASWFGVSPTQIQRIVHGEQR
jgi:hypothetical protein